MTFDWKYLNFRAMLKIGFFIPLKIEYMGHNNKAVHCGTVGSILARQFNIIPSQTKTVVLEIRNF